jgi:hypothetical protein
MLEKSTSVPDLFNSLTNEMSTLKQLIQELDSDVVSNEFKITGRHGTFEKLEKTSMILNDQIRLKFLRNYHIDGI